MKTGLKLFGGGFVIAALTVSLSLKASVTTDGGVMLFDVTSGTETYSGTIGSEIQRVVKRGAGKMVLSASSPSFTGKTVDIEEGLLEMQQKDSLGSGNTVTVSNGAQLVLSMTVPTGEEMQCSGGLNDLVITGDGPDGNGAVYKNTLTTAGNAAAFFGNIRLAGDASIYVYDRNGVASGFGRTVDMNGYVLTLKGSGSMFCGYGYQRQANMNVWKNGTLILNGPAVMFEGNPVFEGGSANKVIMRTTCRHKFYDFAPQIGWTLEIENYIVLEASRSFLSGKWDARANTWAGPVTVKASFDVVGSSYSAYSSTRQSITFAGDVTVPDSNKGIVIYQGAAALVRFGGAFANGQLVPRANQVVRAIGDGAFPPNGSDAYHTGSVFEVQPGAGFCTDSGAAALLANLKTTQSSRTSAGKAAVYTEGDTVFTSPITMQTYKLGLKHTGTGTLTFTRNLTASVGGVTGIWWLNDVSNRTVFAGNVTDIALMDVTAGTVEVAPDGRVFMSAGSGSAFVVGGSNITDTAELKIAGGCLDVETPASGSTGYIQLGDFGTKPAKLTITGGALTNRLLGASRAAWDKAVVDQTGGEFFNFNTDWTGAYKATYLAALGKGFYGLHGGVYMSPGRDAIAGAPGSYGAFRVSGGMVKNNTDYYFMNVSRGGIGELTITGGELVSETSGGYLQLGDATEYASTSGGSATLNLCGDGDPQVRIAGWLSMGNRVNGFTSAINLNAGTLECCRIYVREKNAREGTSAAYVNFNGGRMRSSASAANFFGRDLDRPPTAVTIYPKGATFETPIGYTNYFSAAEKNADNVMVVRSATGRGVKRILLPAGMPRTGYAGVLPVRISGGDGSCAVAVMDFDRTTGSVGDELIVTCPGINYTVAPTVTVFGPDWTTEYTCEVQLTDTDQEPGTIYKTGEGLLGFNCVSNQFAGTVVVSNGTFYVPARSEVSTALKVRCAGGNFEYDWKSRIISELGGYGEVKGSPCDGTAHNLTVTDTLHFDADDILLGRTLVMNDDSTGTGCDRIILGENAVLRIDHLDRLLAADGRFRLLTAPYPLNRLPTLADELPGGWALRISADQKVLSIQRLHGIRITVR